MISNELIFSILILIFKENQPIYHRLFTTQIILILKISKIYFSKK